MTTKERNLKIKKLAKELNDLDNSNPEFYKILEEITEKFRTLYRAGKFIDLNKTSILILLTVNRKYNIIPKHWFASELEIKDLL